MAIVGCRICRYFMVFACDVVRNQKGGCMSYVSLGRGSCGGGVKFSVIVVVLART